MLYPPPDREEDEAGPSTRLRSNSYEPFRMLDTRIEEGLRGMAEAEQKRLEEDPKGMNGEFRFDLWLSSKLSEILCGRTGSRDMYVLGS